MVVLETVKYLGPTLNPWNTNLGAGGSSGGEGALLPLHGSPLGVGSESVVPFVFLRHSTVFMGSDLLASEFRLLARNVP